MGTCSAKKREVVETQLPQSQVVTARPSHDNDKIEMHIQLMSNEMRKKLQTVQIKDIISEYKEQTPLSQLNACMKIILDMNQMEEKVCSLKVPTDIFQNFQHLLYPTVIELSQEDVQKIKNPNLTVQLLETITESFHIIKTYAEQESLKFFNENTIVELMKKKYNDLAGLIKIEMIQSFQKIIKTQSSSNNPMMQMRFNTKHAIGLAKQKTLKDQSKSTKEEVEAYLEDLYDQAIKNLDEQPQYDSLFDILESNLVKEKIEKLSFTQKKFILKL